MKWLTKSFTGDIEIEKSLIYWVHFAIYSTSALIHFSTKLEQHIPIWIWGTFKRCLHKLQSPLSAFYGWCEILHFFILQDELFEEWQIYRRQKYIAYNNSNGVNFQTVISKQTSLRKAVWKPFTCIQSQHPEVPTQRPEKQKLDIFSRRFMKWNATILVFFFNPHELPKIVHWPNTKHFLAVSGPPFSGAVSPFQFFSALWDFFRKISDHSKRSSSIFNFLIFCHKMDVEKSQRVPLLHFSVLRMFKLPIFLFFSNKLFLVSPQFGQTFGFLGYCKKTFETLKSFSYFWALDMTPTYVVPGLFDITNSI